MSPFLMKTLNLFLVLVVAFFTTGCEAKSPQSLTPIAAKPNAHLLFSLKDMDDAIHTLSEYKGKPVIINFWATWCPPCREELPSMKSSLGKDQG